MLKTHTKVIDGITYTTETLPAEIGCDLAPKIMSLFGQQAMALMFMGDENGASPLDDPQVKAAVLSGMASASSDGELLFVKTLLSSTTADKVQIGDSEGPGNVAERFGTHFAGRYLHLVAVAWWVGTVNFNGS